MWSDADGRAQLDERLRAALETTDSGSVRPGGAPSAELLRVSLSAGKGPLGRPRLFVKRVLRRLMREVLARQTDFNLGIDAELVELRAQVAAAEQHAGQQTYALRQCERRIAALEAGAAGAREQSAGHARELAGLGAQVRGARVRLERIDGESGDHEFDYIAFTDRFRGSGREIAARQESYLARFEGQSDVVDIGCGRGEFLQLLQSAGISAVGVDLEPAMVERCRLQGLDAICEDAIVFLESRPEDSLGGVYAAQLIEHLHPSRITRLLELCRSRLRPGGVVLLETVNPQSLMTFASFYIDPTHVKPVHPLAMEWLAQSLGFDSVEIEYHSPVGAERLLPPPLPSAAASTEQVAAWERALAHANALLYGPLEYAIIAVRPS